MVAVLLKRNFAGDLLVFILEYTISVLQKDFVGCAF